MFESELKAAWLSISEISLSFAEVRDQYLETNVVEGRFVQLTAAYNNLNIIEQALFEYMEIKSPMFSKKPNREVLMIAEAAVENSKILLDVARGELALLLRTVIAHDR